jgi:hypothetical protein
MHTETAGRPGPADGFELVFATVTFAYADSARSLDADTRRPASSVSPQVRREPEARASGRCACGGVIGQAGECVACKSKRLAHLDVVRSPGRPLDAGSRSFFERGFGHDFSQVRVHADAEAAESASAVKAAAYTVGRHVVFGAGRYAPTTTAGSRLIGHELAHVIQQEHGDTASLRLPEGDSPSHESDAENASRAVLRGARSAPRLHSPVRLARAPQMLEPRRQVGRAKFDGSTIVASKGSDRAECDAFTSGSAPTPQGRFCIRRQGEAQRLGGVRGALARWVLDPVYNPFGAGPVRKDTRHWFLIEPQFDTTRSRMQIHYGIASEGCITVRDSDCFHRLEGVLELPGTASGWGYDGYPPGNDAGKDHKEQHEEKRSVDCVAWLDVSSSSLVDIPVTETVSAPYRVTAQEEMPLYRTLRSGDTGLDVKTLQTILSGVNPLGFRPEASGRFGPETKAAVEFFQFRHGLAANGIAGPATLAKLRSSQPIP